MSRFIALLLFVFCTNAVYAQSDAPAKLTPPISGDMMKLTPFDKPVEIPTVLLSSGDKGSSYLTDYRTKLVVLNIWATWCPPCVQELPSLNALQQAMGGNLFDVVTVSIDTTGAEAVKKYLTDQKLDKLPAYIDANHDVQKLSVLKGVPGIPVSLIIDPQGHVIAKVEGDADWNGPAARKVLEYYAKHVSYSSI